MQALLQARVSTTDQTISHPRAQPEATKEAQTAGIKAARQADGAGTKYRGRKPTFDVEQLHRTHELLSVGRGPKVAEVPRRLRGQFGHSNRETVREAL
jgi:hypothetical protein